MSPIRKPLLAERERQVLEGLAAGKSLKRIAVDTGHSYNAIRSCAGRLYKRLGVDSAVQAVAEAYYLRLIAVPTTTTRPKSSHAHPYEQGRAP